MEWGDLRYGAKLLCILYTVFFCISLCLPNICVYHCRKLVVVRLQPRFSCSTYSTFGCRICVKIQGSILWRSSVCQLLIRPSTSSWNHFPPRLQFDEWSSTQNWQMIHKDVEKAVTNLWNHTNTHTPQRFYNRDWSCMIVPWNILSSLPNNFLREESRSEENKTLSDSDKNHFLLQHLAAKRALTNAASSV